MIEGEKNKTCAALEERVKRERVKIYDAKETDRKQISKQPPNPRITNNENHASFPKRAVEEIFPVT